MNGLFVEILNEITYLFSFSRKYLEENARKIKMEQTGSMIPVCDRKINTSVKSRCGSTNLVCKEAGTKALLWTLCVHYRKHWILASSTVT